MQLARRMQLFGASCTLHVQLLWPSSMPHVAWDTEMFTKWPAGCHASSHINANLMPDRQHCLLCVNDRLLQHGTCSRSRLATLPCSPQATGSHHVDLNQRSSHGQGPGARRGPGHVRFRAGSGRRQRWGKRPRPFLEDEAVSVVATSGERINSCASC